MFKKAVLLLLTLLVAVPLAICTPPPSVRYMDVERIDYIEDFQFNDEYYDVTHFCYTFAVWQITEWADRAYFTAVVEREQVEIVVANWSVGFSTTFGLQGIWIDQNTDLITVETIMEEFPFNTTTLINPIDGEQAYRFFRMHFYFTENLFVNEKVKIYADYMQAPIIEEVDYMVPDPLIVSAAPLPTSTTGDVIDLIILSTDPSGYLFTENIPEFPVPESPVGSIMALAVCIGVFGGFAYLKRKRK